MILDRVLQQEINDTQLRISREKEEFTYKRELKKRIELINWVLKNIKNPRLDTISSLCQRLEDKDKKIKKLN